LVPAPNGRNRTAFLNGTTDEEIIMEIPEGFPRSKDNTKVCRINRALFGLKQSSKAWYDYISSWLYEQGMFQSDNDLNLFYLRRDGKITILLLYVDDLMITRDDQ